MAEQAIANGDTRFRGGFKAPRQRKPRGYNKRSRESSWIAEFIPNNSAFDQIPDDVIRKVKEKHPDLDEKAPVSKKRIVASWYVAEATRLRNNPAEEHPDREDLLQKLETAEKNKEVYDSSVAGQPRKRQKKDGTRRQIKE
eukprot:4626_1